MVVADEKVAADESCDQGDEENGESLVSLVEGRGWRSAILPTSRTNTEEHADDRSAKQHEGDDLREVQE